MTMVKNGLFLISLAFFIFMISGVNPSTMKLQNPFTLGLCAVLLVAGIVVFYIGNKKAKTLKKEEGSE